MFLVVAPDEDRARLRIDDDVEAVLRAIVDDDVEAERGGDAPARALDDVDARDRKALRLQPPLRLRLRRRAGRLRPLGEKHHFPPALGGHRGEALDDARLGLLERLPEVLDRFDVAPEAPLLAGGQFEAEERRHVFGGGLRGRLLIGRRVGRRLGGSGRCRGRSGRRRGRWRLQAPRHRFAEQDLGLAHQLALHVGEHAVEIECDPQGQMNVILAQGRRRRRQRPIIPARDEGRAWAARRAARCRTAPRRAARCPASGG